MDAFFIFSAKYLIALPILILGIYFLSRPWESKMRMVTFAIPALLLTLLVGYVANHIFSDPRPFVVGNFTPLIPHAPDNGFPSDHALLVTALATLGMFWNKRIGIVLWAIAIVVMFARVYVGVHHALDVIGSAVISLIVISLVRFLFTRVWHRDIR